MNAARLALALLLLCSLSTSSSVAANPAQLWIVPLANGQTIEQAWDAGAIVLDRFPQALLVADDSSVEGLAAAGFDLEGPVVPAAGNTVALLRPRHPASGVPAPSAAVDMDAIAALPGVRVLWTDGCNVLVEAEGAFESAPPVLDLGKKVLSTTPMQRPLLPLPVDRFELPSDILEPTEFPAEIDPIVAEADPTDYFRWIRYLSGADPVEIGGTPFRFMTRYTHFWHCDKAEEYVYERFVDMGFTSVEYDTFRVGTSYARNVIATLPGTVTPEHIYILCGHLDSISENPTLDAPGANDNASGTAVVLSAAEILKDYEFRSTIRFCAFTGEEQGLYGSGHYANVVQAAHDSILGVVNCDMVAYWDDDYGLLIQGPTWCALLMHIVEEACAQYTGLSTEHMYAAWGSDHVSFLRSGYPACLAIELDYHSYPHYHRTTDFAHHNSAVFGTDVLRASLATIAYLAGVVGPRGASGATGTAGLPTLASGPNPFAQSTVLRFALAAPGRVNVSIYDMAGRLVRELVNEARPPGSYRTSWDGRDGQGREVGAGVYFTRLVTEDVTNTGKLIRVRSQ
jgi:hypothetical protein